MEELEVVEATEAIEQALLDLAGLFLPDETLATTLEHIALGAVRAIPACDAAGVSVLERHGAATAAASGAWARRIDEFQHEADEGPCLEALRSGAVRLSRLLADEKRWPTFVARAIQEGLVSCLSVPLIIGNGTLGALNLYSQRVPFDESDQELARGFAVPASAIVANARAYARAQTVIDELRQALESRDVIGQAKGMIREREHCDADTAFERLRMISQRRNIKVRDIAESLLSSPDEYLGRR